MSRIVAVSNRVAEPRHKASAGGLAVGVLGALEKDGGVWFGWNGELVSGESQDPVVHVRQGVTYATIALNDVQFERYYNGFCNNTLWPLFHYRLGLFEYDRGQYESYVAVSDLFARKLRPLLRHDDLIWVHDFHLIPLGQRLRTAGVEQPLGFFLHTPFPSFEVLRALPVHEDLLRSLCGYDVVGFQTARDLRGFLDAVTQPGIGATPLADGSLRFGDHTVRALVCPIGVDVEDCARRAAASEGSRQLAGIRASLHGRRLLIGVDRLDYSKGLPKRFEAFETLLEQHAEFRREITFTQIAAPTRSGVRAYTEIRHELERLAGHINGRFAEVDWVPLRYLNRAIERGVLLAMFRLARVGLVTPFRDGMNLVAKEYVAAQDPADPGVLVLSTMAGAAEELRDAVLVNPFDTRAVSEGIRRGLTMSRDERRARHAALLDVLRRNDIDAWRERFVAALRRRPATGVARA
ncbi:MAG TPA: trehalose-6-phosphate synthase [Gammaproteobacteria bacterium]|nr:trehalose-6-phosphate synthase [Gammaproteobacteria bacterium]